MLHPFHRSSLAVTSKCIHQGFSKPCPILTNHLTSLKRQTKMEGTAVFLSLQTVQDEQTTLYTWMRRLESIVVHTRNACPARRLAEPFIACVGTFCQKESFES